MGAQSSENIPHITLVTHAWFVGAPCRPGPYLSIILTTCNKDAGEQHLRISHFLKSVAAFTTKLNISDQVRHHSCVPYLCGSVGTWFVIAASRQAGDAAAAWHFCGKAVPASCLRQHTAPVLDSQFVAAFPL